MSTLGALQYVPLSDDVRTVKSVEMAGRQIACFVVGGEPRLCLPQLLRVLVDHVDVEALESARARYC